MITLLAACLCLAEISSGDRACVAMVVGASGSPDYAGQFSQSAELWQAAAAKAGVESILIGRSQSQSQDVGMTDRDRLHTALLEKASTGQEPLWIVLIGHGTFDGREAKFNLR